MSDFFVKENLAGLKREDFQATVEGKKTDLYILRNKKGAEIAVTNFAGALCAVMMPDRNGKMESVVWGHDSIKHVMESQETYLSVLIGRYGNRIANGKFTLDGKQYTLAINNDPNSLHGGPTGFHKRIFDAEQTDAQTIKLHYLCKDGEEGFPGNLDVNVTYRLTDENELVIEYEATTDKKTVVCLTNRTIDEVEGTPFDFRTPHRVGDRIEEGIQTKNGNGYDHCWVLNKREPGELSFAVKCVDPASGRTLECYTTEPGVQCYSGNWCSGSTCAHGSTLPKRCAICFEAEHFPDSPNRPYFPSTVLNPGEVYTQTTIYRFGVE